MSRYTLFEGSPDYIQNDRTPLVNTEIDIDNGTVKGGGNVAANGPADAIEKVEIYEETYDGTYVAGVNNGVGASQWQLSVVNQGVAAVVGGQWDGNVEVTDTGHDNVVGDVVQLIDTNVGGFYTGVYRVVAVTGPNTYVVNYPHSVVAAAGIDVYHGNYTDATLTTHKPVGGYPVAGAYNTRRVSRPIWNGSTLVDTMTNAASEYGRRKIHSRTAVRTKLVEVSIRAGDWNPYTGQFNNPVGEQNDFTAFGVDEEVQDSNFGWGVKGEFAYRYGITVTQDEYEV